MTSSGSAGMDKEHRLRVSTMVLPLEEAAEFTEALAQRRKEDSPAADYSLQRARGVSPTPLPGEILSLVRVEVEDTGPGIPREALGKIFDPFYRSTKDRGKPGFGLGMAIVKQICTLNNYHLSIDSKPNVYTSVHVSRILPVLTTS